MGQGRFAATGENLFLVTNKLSLNQRLCRLLKYGSIVPFAITEEQPDIDGTTLVNRNILLQPKPADDIMLQESFVIITADDFYLNPENNKFKIHSIKFNILCPHKDWIVEEPAPRPFLIMQEIDTMFNGTKLQSIGTLRFVTANRLTVSWELGGYVMEYKVDDFN